MFSQVRSGALDFMSTSGVNQTVVPVGGINAVAFAFDDYSKVWAAMDGDLGAYVRAQFEKAGLHVFEKVLDNGFRNITTGAKPINAPEDLKGLKIRVPGNQLWVTMFNALGAAPTPINFGELYAALQTRIVDGQENPLALISSSKLYEVQKYIAADRPHLGRPLHLHQRQEVDRHAGGGPGRDHERPDRGCAEGA